MKFMQFTGLHFEVLTSLKKFSYLPVATHPVLKRNLLIPERSGLVMLYRITQNFSGKKFWRNCDFETLAEKTLANPRLACIFIVVRA